MNILGVSALYHDSAACLVRDGEIVAAAQEERFTRIKHDSALPRNAISYVLREGGVGRNEIDLVAYYDKPVTKFVRFLATHAQVAPRGLRTFMMGVPAWLRGKVWVARDIEQHLKANGFGAPGEFVFSEHHMSHAASAFYPSPFQGAAVLTTDGVGEWACSAISVGEDSKLRMLREVRFPHSLGLLYSAFTYFCGFRVNSGEYKLMGLAPYGEPTYVDVIKEHLVDLREDGSIRLNMSYFGFLDGLHMTNDRFAALFGGPARSAETEITRREMDLARSVQVVTEEAVLNMARYARALTGKKHLCLAGGVALNCVANGHIVRSGEWDGVWIQPAAGDAGGALGAALYAWHHVLDNDRVADAGDSMRGGFLGPKFSADQTRAFLDANELPYIEMDDAARDRAVAQAVADQKVVGLFQGRMEFGPRALGGRSILADARSSEMQSYLNLATKFRESFRPFAPIVLAEDAPDYFEEVHESPYMLLVDQVREERRLPTTRHDDADLMEWVNQPRSDVPAITHVDYSARIQTVDRVRNPRLHAVLSVFKELTGSAAMVNTSFNVRGEPIVCTPEDAYRCFMRTGMHCLVIDNFILWKDAQPEWPDTDEWRDEYALD